MTEGIYVEIAMKAGMASVWEKTQTPNEHVQWDLRFTDIEYLPRPDTAKPQHFLYQTRIGFGMAIRGEGETLGNQESDSHRSSALKFWSQDPKSLIEEGSGYWKYITTPTGITFLTWYDYKTRFGLVGRMIDVAIFRPLMGWATAWSFDRLRLWIEKGISPALSLQKSLVYFVARMGVAFVWMYHGLIPKLLFHHPDEIKMLTDGNVSFHTAQSLVLFAGVMELSFGIMMLIAWRARWMFLVTIGLMLVALVSVAVISPTYLVAAFNPVTLNLSMVALSLIGYLISEDIPSAHCCLRKQKS